MSEYKWQFGSYYLRKPPSTNILLMTDQVAIAFDAGNYTMLKHGAPKDVLAWWETNKDKAPGLFAAIQVMTLPRGMPVEEINRVLSTAGYMKYLLKKIEDNTLELLPVEGPRQGG